MLVLVGGGQTHALLLKNWIEQPDSRPNGKILLINQQTTTPYAPMLTDVIQKKTPESKILIPIQHLCSRANVEFMQDVAIGLDLKAREVYLGFRISVNYEYLSLNSGGFVPRISPRTCRSWLDKVEQSSQVIYVLGATLWGAETALALRVRFPDREIHMLETPNPRFSDVNLRLRRQLEKLLAAQKIRISNTPPASDALVVSCTAATAPRWMRVSGLQVQNNLLVTGRNLLTSNDRVFAAGACTLQNVSAHNAAPALVKNLERAMSGRTNFSQIGMIQSKTRLVPLDQTEALIVKGPLSLGPHTFWMKIREHRNQNFMTSLERISE